MPSTWSRRPALGTALPRKKPLDEEELQAAIEALAAVELPADAQFKKAHGEAVENAQNGNWLEFVGKGLAAKIADPDGRRAVLQQAHPTVGLRRLRAADRPCPGRDPGADRQPDRGHAAAPGALRRGLPRAEARPPGPAVRGRHAAGGRRGRGRPRSTRWPIGWTPTCRTCFWTSSRTPRRRSGACCGRLPPRRGRLQHSFFCVGDVKQAIYGWRGGEAEIFDAIQKELPGLAEAYLDTSYRSSPVVIETVNRVFEHLAANAVLRQDKYLPAATQWAKRFHAPYDRPKTSSPATAG